MSKRVGPLRLNAQQFQEWEIERIKSPEETIYNPITGNKISYQGETWKRLEEAYLKMKQKQLSMSLTAPKQGKELEQLMDALNVVQRHTKDPKVAATLTMVSKDLRNRALGKDKPSSKEVKALANQLQELKVQSTYMNADLVKKLIIEMSQRTNFTYYPGNLPIPKANRRVAEPSKEVIALFQPILRERLEFIRKVTRSQRASTLTKVSLSTRRPETAETVFKKLKTWCETHRQASLIEGVQEALSNDIETLTDQMLIDQIHNKFNITRDIAKIYAYYIKEYVYQVLVRATDLLEIQMTSGLTIAQSKAMEKVIVLTVDSIRPYITNPFVL